MKPGDPRQPESESLHAVLEMASAFMASRAFLTACELDLFTSLGSGERTSAEVAEDIGADPRATDRLMNVLCALGLLQKKDGRFCNRAVAARFFRRGQPDSVRGLLHWVHLWESWSTLTAAVRAGRGVAARPVDERGDAWLRAFIAAMDWRARQHAPWVIASLDLAGVTRVLDVGGGSGAYAAEFVRTRPGVTAAVFDLPNVLALTAEYLAESGVQDRVTLVPGDYDRDDLGHGFDVVLLSAIVHSNAPGSNARLIRKAAAALNPAGHVVVQDFLVDEQRVGPTFGTLFALNMLVGTEAGDTYTESEVRQWMLDAGLRDVRRYETPFGTSIMVGRRP